MTRQGTSGTNATTTSSSASPVVRRLARPAHRGWHGVDAEPAEQERYTQGALALTFPLSNGLDASPRSRALTLVGGEPVDTTDIPDAERWAGRFLQAVIEVVSSDRPLTQLARWTDRHVYAEIALRKERVSEHRRPGQARLTRQHVATVHIWQAAPDSAEVAARISSGSRSRAIAARLDFSRDRWLCTAICFG
ncbi:MAG: Rv3235 family protein [Nocardioidaceae bacterium]